jgi:putative oxidoreductase
MRRGKKGHVVILLIRWLLAIVFLYAGVIKVFDPAAFAGDVANYRMLPFWGVNLLAVVLPVLEVLCGLLLIFGKWLRGVSLILIVLNAVFIVAIGSAVVRGLDISCGCFGTEAVRVGVKRIIEDVFYMAAAVSIYIFNLQKSSST